MMAHRSRRTRRLLFGLLALIALCLGLALLSAGLNTQLPEGSEVVERLSAADKARIAEFQHLRQTLGNQVWPGWSAAEIPVVIYNEAYAFVVGMESPPAGWRTVPGNAQRGQEWEAVPGDTFAGEVYYRQPLAPGAETPQGFTVRLGDMWAASLLTYQAGKLTLIEQFRRDLPPVVRTVFPYELAAGLFLGDSAQYLSLLAHESFHAYEGIIAPARLAAGERANRIADTYPWTEPGHLEAWQVELNLLRQAVETEDDAEALALARSFLANRASRREAAGLSAQLVQFERHREWVEGLAKYTELVSWRTAASQESYAPLPALADDPAFDGYDGFRRRFSQEIEQISRMAGDEGDGRFYYSGLAQALLLERLSSAGDDWKMEIMQADVFLEDLLERTVLTASENS